MSIYKEIKQHAEEHAKIIKRHNQVKRGLLSIAMFIREFKR